MDYNSWKLYDIKLELKKRGAIITGKKAELIKRLEHYDRNNNFNNVILISDQQKMIIPQVEFKDLHGDKNHPSLMEAFQNGFFVLNKSGSRFSDIGLDHLDQAHEQNNAIIKGVGGAINLTQNTSAFYRWMLSGPEIARLIEDFQKIFIQHAPNLLHHEET